MKSKIFVGLVVLFFFFSFVDVVAVGTNDVLSSTVGYWKFGNSSPRLDSRVSLHNLTKNGTWGNKTGKVGDAKNFSLPNSGFVQYDNVFDRLSNSQDFSVSFWYKADSLSASGSPVGQWDSAASANTRWSLYFDDDNGGLGHYALFWCNGWVTPVSDHNFASWSLWSVVWNETNNDVQLWRNNSIVVHDTGKTCGAQVVGKFGGFKEAYSGDPAGTVDELIYTNKSLNYSLINYLWNSGNGIDLASTQAPVISAINCTSCNQPLGDTVSPYATADTTPTFRLSTDIDSYCRIGKTNSNWTSMGGSRNCSSTGSKSHNCTLTVQDELIFSNDIVYLSCKNINSNGQSTSSAQMNITGLGDTSNNAIDLGISSSEGSSGIVYDDQKVYLRNRNNQAVLATVDRVLVYGNKRYIFNYAGAGESNPALFNITPHVYSLRMYNISSSSIRQRVENLINSTN